MLDEFLMKLCAVRAHAVASEDNVRLPGEHFVADDRQDCAGFVGIVPAAMQDDLVLEAQIAREGNPFAVQFGEINRQIETVAGYKNGLEALPGGCEFGLVADSTQRQRVIDSARCEPIVGFASHTAVTRLTSRAAGLLVSSVSHFFETYPDSRMRTFLLLSSVSAIFPQSHPRLVSSTLAVGAIPPRAQPRVHSVHGQTPPLFVGPCRS